MVHTFENVDSLIDGTAKFFVEQANEAIRKNGRFTVALSGGSSPKKLHALLASDTYRKQIAWEHVFFFFGDERFVPADDEQSNYRMARETLFTPLNIANSQVKPVNTTVTPSESARLYEHDIRQHFVDACRFDLIILGLGDDAHTASLFPGTEVLHEKNALVKEVYVEKVKQFRITFTAPLINNAAVVAFLTYGASKTKAVHQIFRSPFNPDQYPAQLIKPHAGTVHWLIDKEAASAL